MSQADIGAQADAFLEASKSSSFFLAALILLPCLHYIYATLAASRPLPGLPLVSLNGLSPRASWRKHGNGVVKKGLEEHDGPFQVLAGTGPKVVLPNRYAEEVKNCAALSLTASTSKDFFIKYPGFEGPRTLTSGTDLIQNTIRTALNRSLGELVEDLADEAGDAIAQVFGLDEQWHTVTIWPAMLSTVAQMASRAFLGKQLCRDQRWLEIAKNYTNDAFAASMELRKVPALLRPIVFRFLPHCTKCRRHYKDATRLIAAELEQRKLAAQMAYRVGEKPPKKEDAIAWFVDVAKEQSETIDLVAAQLGLTIAAMLAPTDSMCQVLQDLCEHPELFQPLREEEAKAVGEHGWTQDALSRLELMDSLLKESQRLNRSIGMSMTHRGPPR